MSVGVSVLVARMKGVELRDVLLKSPLIVIVSPVKECKFIDSMFTASIAKVPSILTRK